MAITILAIAAGAWGLIMAISPALQIQQMLRTRSSKEVSLGYFGILLPGFALWVAYGAVRGDFAILIPNVVALLVGTTTFVVAAYLRSQTRADEARGGHRTDPAPAERPGAG
jgi:MtN3 and saliva related transmembrane protein